MSQLTDATQTLPVPATRRRRAPVSREIVDLFPRQGEWTEQEYNALPEKNRIVELCDGRVVIPDLPGYSHQYAVGELFAILRAFIREHELGSVALAPLRVRLWPGRIREPDIVFMRRDHADRISEECWGVPDLTVEVISPHTPQSSGTEHVDRGDKLSEYARAGVAEYWLVDPGAPVIEIYVLEEGAYHLAGRWRAGEVARSRLLPGLAVPVASLTLSFQ